MSESLNFPTVMPSLLLDFANAKQLDPRITFTRASTATYYDEDTVAKAEENLLTYSQEFEVGPDTNWENAANTSIVTANSTSAPDGTSTADTIAQTAVTNTFILQQRKTILANTNYTISTFVKNIDINYVAVAIFGATGNAAYAEFDLTTGTLNRSGANGTGWAVVSTAIQNVGNSWYRISAVITAGNTVSTPRQRFMLTDGTTAFSTSGTVSFAGTNLSAYFWGAQLEQRSAVTAYTPTTTAPITNYIPVLLTAAVGVPRFDFNPTTRESLGLLIEEQRANLLLQSEDFDTTWAETRATLGLNAVVAPNGTLTADQLIASTDNNTHFTTQTVTGTAVAHTFSVYAKASGLNHIALRLYNGTSQVGLAYYNLSTGATGTVTAGTATIASVGNGWYRCALTATLAASAACTADIYLANADNTNSFAGDAFNGVTLWGAQLEAGSFATSYIPTVASSVTRAADSARMTGNNFSQWYRQDEGTLYLSGLFTTGTSRIRFQVSTSSSDNDTLSTFTYTAGGSGQTFSGGSFSTAESVQQRAVAYGSTTAIACSAGNLSSQMNKGLPTPLFDAFYIGRRANSSAFTNGTIKRIAYYPWRLTNAQLQALTS